MPHTKFHRGKRAGKKHRSRKENLMREYPQFYGGVEDGNYDLSYNDPKVYHRLQKDRGDGVPGVKTYNRDKGAKNRLTANILGFAFEDIMQNILTKESAEFAHFFNNSSQHDDSVPDDYKMVARMLVEHGIFPGNLEKVEYTTKIDNITEPARKHAKKPDKKHSSKQPKTDLAIIAKDNSGKTTRIGISQKNSCMSTVPFHSGSIENLTAALDTPDRDKIYRLLDILATTESSIISGDDQYNVYNMLDTPMFRMVDGARFKQDIEESIDTSIPVTQERIKNEYVIPLLRNNLRSILKVVISGEGFNGQSGIENADYTLKRNKDTGKAYLRSVDEYIEELMSYDDEITLTGNPEWNKGTIVITDEDGVSLPLVFKCYQNKKGQGNIKVQLPTMF